jgi:hypothetical protein
VLLGAIQIYLFLTLALVAFGVEVWALVHAARVPPAAFVSAGKRTKNFWLLVLGGTVALGFLAIPPPLGVGIFAGFLSILLIVPAAVYLADVRPAVSGYRRRPPRGGGW